MHFLEILGISLKELLNPQFYITHGGLWMILFIVFAETGLFAGFFLPGDALLFVTGIFSDRIVSGALFVTNNQWADLGVSVGVDNHRRDSGKLCRVLVWEKKAVRFYTSAKTRSFLRKNICARPHDFYDKNGGGAIIIARFVPFVRTFAPIVAGDC